MCVYGLVAISMSRRKIMQAYLKESSPYLATLKMMAAYLGPQRSFSSNLEFFLQTLAKKHEFLRAHLILFEPETGLLRLRFADSSQKVNEATYSPGVGVTGQVFTTGKSVIVEKMQNDPHFMSLLFSRTSEEMENLAFISVPVLAPIGSNPMNARNVIGTLNVDTRAKDKDILMLQCLFLEIVASFIANGVAYVQDEMSRLWRFDAAANSINNDVDDFFFSFSKVMRHIGDQANHLAQGRAPLLLIGEAGVGKELLAKRIHKASSRKDMPFVVCHCTTLSDEKMQAELVGYQKGAFHGAVQTQKGLFEQAQDGTFFLDTVESLNAESQRVLLHLLKEHEITRMGVDTSISCDVRVVVASTVSLESLVQEGLFSEELFARLNLYTLQIPPLRERREDIIPFAEQILLHIANAEEKDESSENNRVKRISYPALQLLTHYYWPGNVPELQKCMEQAAQNCTDQVIRAGDLPPSLQTAESTSTEHDLSLGDAVERFEKEMIADALIKASGNILKAARILKSSYRIVNYKVKKYDINPRQFSVRKL